MRKPKKITVIVTTVLIIVLSVVWIKAKSNMEKIEKEAAQKNKAEILTVKEGDLDLIVSATGNVVPKNNDNTNYNNLVLELEVDELDIPKVKIDQQVKIEVDAFKEQILEGRVIDIADSTQDQVTGQANSTGVVQNQLPNTSAKYTVKVSLPNQIIETASVDADTLTLRERQGKKYLAMKELKKGDKIEVIEKDDNWYKVKSEDEKVGWVLKKNIDITGIKPESKGVANSDTVNVREDASGNSDIKVKIIKGQQFDVLEKDSNWYKIRLDDGIEGWVKKNDIKSNNLKAGMNANANILIAREDNTLYLPIKGVFKKDDSKYYVKPVKSSKYKCVEIGIRNEDYIELKSGVNKGDKVEVIKNRKQGMKNNGPISLFGDSEEEDSEE